MSYSNPSFPVSPTSNVGPMANAAHAPYTHKANTAPAAYTAGYPAAAAPAYRASDTGIILVLFILLVIISRAWCV